MIVIKQFAAKFQIKFTAKGIQPLTDMLRLQEQIFFVVEAAFFHE